jgi:hypothetical protein
MSMKKFKMSDEIKEILDKCAVDFDTVSDEEIQELIDYANLMDSCELADFILEVSYASPNIWNTMYGNTKFRARLQSLLIEEIAIEKAKISWGKKKSLIN